MLTIELRMIIKFEHVVRSLVNTYFGDPFLDLHLSLKYMCLVEVSNQLRPAYDTHMLDCQCTQFKGIIWALGIP